MTTTTTAGTRELLLGFTKRRYREECIAGINWRLKSLTEGEKARFEQSCLNKKGMVRDDARRRLLILMLVDDDGDQLLLDTDVRLLAELDAAVTQRLFEVAMEHAGFQPDDVDDMVKKNSQLTREDDSPLN
tara:strand:+ start:359 stop:751 length:393 start_codon:yes stop_codon:yes gene_type:complete